jgi:hypothetical protein
MLLTPSSLGLGHEPDGKAVSAAGSPAWRVDLRSVGFTGFAPEKETWGLHLRPNPLCFSDDKVLIATFITREDLTILARRGQPGEPLPLRLHGTFLDAEAGKVESTKEWSITRPRGGIIAVGGGKFAVLTPEMIALYLPSLEVVRDLKLSAEQQSHLWDFRSSPTGKSIVVEYHYPEASYQWIDTNSLLPQPISIPTVAFSISDDDVAIVRNPFIQSKGFLAEVLIRTADGPWRTVCRVLPGQPGHCGSPEFISNEVLALLMPHELSLISKTSGDALFKATFRDDEWLGPRLNASADGERFAVTVWAHKGGNTFSDVGSHSVLKRIVVYDLPSGQAIYTLDAKRQNIRDVSGVALSPNGSLMAILTDGVVEVYRIY